MTNLAEKSRHGVFRVGERLIGIPIENLAEVCLVPSMSKMMVEDGPVLGAFDLRGNIVPLLDGEAFCGLSKRATPVSRAAVVRHGDRVAAIAIDDIVNLTEAHPTDTDLGALAAEPYDTVLGMADPIPFPRGFVLNGEIVSCLEARALFSRHDVLSVAHVRAGQQQSDSRPERKYLIFCAGGVHFSVDTKQIWATVPRNELDPTGVRVEGGICLGFIEHLGWRVPVVATNRVFGLGQPTDPTQTEVVVLRFPDDKLLGLQVDAMERLSSVPVEELQDTGPLVGKDGILRKVFVSKDGTQIFMIDFESLSKHPDLLSFSEFTARNSASESKPPKRNGSRNAAVRERIRYLVFEAGFRQAIPADRISRILKMPEIVVPALDMPAGVKGFFAVGGRSVPLLALSDNVGEHGSDGFVLMVTANGSQVGFHADRICAIQTSEWRIPAAVAEAEGQDLIQVADKGEASFVPVPDIDSRARSIMT